MKKTYTFLLFIFSIPAFAQTDSLSAVMEISAFQNKLNDEFKNREESPLDAEHFDRFETLDFFPIDLNYRVNAKLTVTDGTPFFAMKTTTSRVATERIYGYVSFTLDGQPFRLPVYQSKDLMQTEEYADYLFFPFTDETNGNQTYEGGRYIDLHIPKEDDSLVIDFNMAYNPYCAYSPRYSCPIVPVENQMNIEVRAGVKYQKDAPYISRSDSSVTHVEVQPEYPGGLLEMMKFISKEMKYPKAAVKQRIEGTVYVKFIVAPDGSVSDVETLVGISEECDREAERVVSLMPKWKPGQVNGKNVAVRFILPIKFKGRPKWSKE